MLFENMNAAFALHEMIYDEQGNPQNYRYLELNPMFEKLTGAQAQDFLGHTIKELMPETEQYWIDTFGNVAKTGKPISYENYASVIGKHFDTYVFSPQQDQFAVFFIDITERKTQEEELKSFFAVNPDLLCIADVEGNFIKTNAAWETILGYTTDELNQKKFLEFIHPDDMDATLNAMDQLKQGETILQFTNRYRSQDGTYRYLEWRSQPREKLIYAAARDITENILAEEELRKNEARYRSVIKVSNTGAWEYHRSQNYLWCSPEYFQMLGRDPEDYPMEGQANLQDAWIDLIHPEDAEQAGRLFKAYLDAGSAGIYESFFRMIHQDGSVVWIWSRGQTLVDSQGKPGDVTVGTHINITEMKQAELVIQQSKRTLADKNKELEQLVYVASHDLRSPLVNVDGYSRELQFALDEIGSTLGDSADPVQIMKTLEQEFPDMKQALERIRASARQMDGLLKGLLKLSRSGRAALEFGPIDMNKVLSQLVSSFSYKLQENNVELSLADLPDCYGDITQVTQVFSNLLENAIKYLDTERPGKIALWGTVVDRTAVYRIQDNGIGIAENHQNNIFELFHRLNPADSQGEGLGLTITRQILGRMNGSISVESELGRGSIFTVSLPNT